MPHQDEPLVEVEGVELGVRTAGTEPVEEQHRDVRLEIAFAGGGHAPCGEQRVAGDQGRADPLGEVAADAAVVVGERVELEVRDQPVETDGDARRPREHVGRDLPGDRVVAGVRELEDLADLVLLPRDRGVVGRLDACGEVVDSAPDVRAGLRVHLREVGVHVQHPRIRVSEEADARDA